MELRYAYLSTNFGIEIAAVDPSSGALQLLAPAPTPNHYTNASGYAAISPSGKTLIDVNSVSPFGFMETFTIDPVTGDTIKGTTLPLDNVRGLVFAPNGFLYTADLEADTIQPYSLDETTGTLTPVGTGAPNGDAEFTVIEPTGHFLYSVDPDVGHDSISGFALAPDGTVTAIAGGFPLMLGNNTDMGPPLADPTGKFLAVPLGNSLGVAMYAIDATTGALTPVVGSPFAGDANAGVFSHDGRFLYVNGGGLTLGGYAVDANTGALTALANLPSPGPASFQAAMSIDPTGNFLYISRQTTISDTVAYRIASDGSLTETSRVAMLVGPLLFGALGAPVTVSLHSAYVINNANPNGSVEAFSVSTTGTLAAAGAPAGLLDGWQAVADPRGKFLYVASSSQGIYGFAIASDGSLTELGGSPYAPVGVTSLALAPSGNQLYAAISSTQPDRGIPGESQRHARRGHADHAR